MRIVEYERSPSSVAYRALWAAGVVAGLFSLIVCAFMIANNLRLKTSDPIHSPALQRLVQELKSSPQNETFKEQIRELDYLARRAFFTSQRFNQLAIWLLTGGVVVTIVAFKTLSAYHRKVPFPNSHDAQDDLAANARWARQSITVVGLILLGLALSLALPWRSTLDQPPRDAVDGSTPMAKHVEPGQPTVSAPATTPARTGPPPASRADRLKHWPSFRGAASGHVAVSLLPTQWDGTTGQGILWRTALPLPGFGSPIVWGDRVFVSGANTQTRAVYAVDANSGQLIWEKTVLTQPAGQVAEVSQDTGYAAPTMATDGARVFAMFATGDLAAFDFDGNQLWAQHFGVPPNPYGHSSSLELFEDTVLVQFDHKQDGFVAALDVRTGAPRWKTPRRFGPSWASPTLIELGSHTELILVANTFVTSYDPKTGRELWRLECLGQGDVAPTPVFANGLLYVAADQVKLVAIDVKTHQVVWETQDEIPGIGTPLAAGELLLAGLGNGGIACWDAKTGRVLWRQETDEGFYASPILAGNRVYLTDRTGKAFIFEATGAGFKALAQPRLGEGTVTTPAVYAESLIIRGAKHLFRIGT